MISQLALIAWIIAGASLFMLTTPTRAFILAYTMGILVLPVESIQLGQGTIILTYSLRIDKYVACHLAVLIGTVLFCPQLLSRLRLGLIDAIYGAMLAGIILTYMVVEHDLKTGFSNAVSAFIAYYPAIVFARIYITSLADLNIVMRTLVGAAVIYGVICLIEVRISPQIHRLLYGYFQHSFAQFIRYGMFRPAGMMRHAIEVSFFMGTCTVLATGLVWRKMFPPLWGMIPGYAVVGWLLFCLFMTFTVSGYVAFFAGFCTLMLLHLTQKRAFILVLPVFSVAWMVLRYFGEIDTARIISLVSMFNAERSESLEYRLNAEAVYLFGNNLNPLLGGGTDIVMRGKPVVDAFWLIQVGFYGWLGLGCSLMLWACGLIMLYRRWPVLDRTERFFCAVACAAIGPMFVDFLVNGFPSHLLMILSVGVATVVARLATRDRRVAVPQAVQAPVQTQTSRPFAGIATRPIV